MFNGGVDLDDEVLARSTSHDGSRCRMMIQDVLEKVDYGIEREYDWLSSDGRRRHWRWRKGEAMRAASKRYLFDQVCR